MKILIEEYGKIILYVIIGISVIGLLGVGIRTWYKNTYPDFGQEYNLIDTYVGDAPIVIAEWIEVEKRDVAEVVDYTKYVVAYSDSNKIKEIIPVVIGADEVDVTTRGLYSVFVLATNEAEQSFTKKVPVLVY